METKTKTKDPRVIGPSKTEGGYTVYKNPNEEMVAEIKAYKPNTGTFDMWYHKDSKIEKDLGGGQLLCIDKDGEYFVCKSEDIEDSGSDKYITEINTKYNVADTFNSVFPELYTNDGYRRVKFISFKEQYSRPSDSMGRVMSTEVGVEVKTYDGISVMTINDNEWGGNMHAHINKDGNIENRDYNIDINALLENKPKNKVDLIEEILANIPDIYYERYGNNWFSTGFAFRLRTNVDDKHKYCFILEKLPSKGSDNYGDRWKGSIKKPKSAKSSNRGEILSIILPLINELEWGGKVDISKYCSVFEEPEAEAKPKERVQKTKLNESDYTVYEFSADEIKKYCEDLLPILLDISQNINVAENVSEVQDYVVDYVLDDLPSFSFNKGQCQEDHSDFKGLIKLPYGCNFTFEVEEGDACEITWAHSIYETDIISFELVE